MSEKLMTRMVQENPSVGDLKGNYDLAFKALQQAEADGIDIVLFSEMFITGYPPKDLILQDHFVNNAEMMVKRLAQATSHLNVAFVMGLPLLRNGKRHNSAQFIYRGSVLREYHKMELPNYGVFDEKRVFDPGEHIAEVLVFKGNRIGVGICEDIWHNRVPAAWGRSAIDILFSPNASPYACGKPEGRLDVIGRAAWFANAAVLYCNQFGAQDELLFDGRSCAVNAYTPEEYEVQGLGTAWDRDVMDCVFQDGKIQPLTSHPVKMWSEQADDYMGAVVGLRDYVRKTGQKKVVFGSSGGIDSALVMAISVDALGADNVIGLMLPSPYSSEGSLTDAIQLAKNLGVKHNYPIKIGGPYEEMQSQMSVVLGENWQLPFEKVGDENLQPRLRMNYINALANELSENGVRTMALTTGNKSEIAVGYFTAGGDGFGFFNPIKDLYKMRVYELSRWRNSAEAHEIFGTSGERIPQAIIDKEPSAELKPGQQDTDSLPPYHILDDVLERVMEKGEDPVQVANTPPFALLSEKGEWYKTVKWVYSRLIMMEYKRQVGPLGPILSRYAFDLDRRYPIVNGYNPFDYVDLSY